MKKTLILLFLTLFIFSCGKNNDTETNNGKKDFSIQTKNIKDFGNNSFLQKSGKIQGKNEITLSSQAIGRIGKIYVKEGDKVVAGQTLIVLNDTIANYGINLEKANNTIEKLKINYDSTKVSLNKQIFDSEIALEKLQNNLETLKKTSSIDISQAQDNLNSNDYSGMDTKSSLELQKLDNNITKSDLDYNNTLTNNKETIENYKNNIKKEYLTQKIFLNDITNFGDKLFNITGLYKDDAKMIEDYLGAKNQGLKSETIQELKTLYTIKENKLKNLSFDNLSDNDILNYINLIDTTYNQIDTFLTSLEKTLNNSIISVGQLNQTQVDSYITIVNTYESQLTVNNSSFTSFKNSATSFINTYKNNESSLQKQLELLKKDREIFLKNYDLGSTQSQNTLDKVISSSDDNIKSLELQIKQTEETIKTNEESRDLTLKGIENSLQDAYISKNVAAKDYNKLTISASIDGVIGEVIADEGQDVNSTTSLLTIISDKASEVELYFKENELSYINVGDSVFAQIGEKNLTGAIYSISSVSDDSLNYKVLAVFNEKIQNIGGVIDVKIPVKSNSILLPIEIVKLVGTNKGTINIYENGKIVQKEILLGKMYKNNIEFLSFLDGTKDTENIKIITTDTSNYDENKYNLKLEQ
ncbi:MAG: HlyD family efflux transporter periplasmic adaptor subunit [Candidatus Gracilibacteria bacterium]|nr:HlyD family efflux transporter periplasmic adaptor subunit [Candidatus Gracilibacteria bacterium]